MAVTESDTTVGNIVNEVGNKLTGVTTDVQEWADKVEQALEATPGESAPQPGDPAASSPPKPAGSFWSLNAADPEKPNTNFNAPTTPVSYIPSDVDRFDDPNDPYWEVNFNDVFSTYEPGTKPSLPTYTAPTVAVPELTTAPVVVPPDEVDLSGTRAPTFNAPTMPNFSVSINPSNLPGISNAFDYNENPYSWEVVSDMLAQIRSVYSGHTVIPSWVWDGIWSRGVGNLKQQELAAIREAARVHASAGWIMPGPVLLARSDAARQKASEAISELTRENVTKQAEMYREDLWKAVETGIAIETLLVKIHDSARERTLRAAVETNNAGIAVYKAALEGYQVTELQAKDMLIKLKDLELRGSLAELEVFDRELKAAGFNLELDRNKIEVYKAQWAGQETRVKAYAAYADAIKSYVMAQQAAVEAFAKQIESNNIILQGWAIEWDAYLKRLKPAELRIQAHEARSSHFGRLVQEYQAKAQSEGTRIESDIKIEQLKLSHMDEEIKKFQALWSGIQTKLDVLTKVYATDAQVYQAKGQVEASRLQSLTQLYSADIQKYQIDLSGKIEGLRNRLGYWDRWMQTWVNWNSASASAYAQLGAAAYSAMNYSMSASGQVGFSDSTSRAHGYSVNISGDAGEGAFDVNPPI